VRGRIAGGWPEGSEKRRNPRREDGSSGLLPTGEDGTPQRQGVQSDGPAYPGAARSRHGSVPLALSALLVSAALSTLLAPASALGASPAGEQQLRVVVVPLLGVGDLGDLADRGAVGLLVPGAGPTVSERSALASLSRGAVRNSLRGGLPAGDALIAVEHAGEIPREGPAIVLALPRGGEQPNDRRYGIAVIAPGYRGLLTSDSTRITGLVSVADVAATALGAEGALGSRPVADPAGALERLDRRIRDNGDARLAAALVAAAGLLASALLGRGRAAVLAFGTVLVANLVLGALAVSAPWATGLGMALAVAAAPALAHALRSPLAAGGALAAVLAGYLAALAADPSLVALSPLGPTQNSRFYGLSNLLSALLLVPALVAAASLGRALGRPAAGLVASLALALAGISRFGADGGGAITLAVAFATLAMLSADRRRAGLAAGVATASAVAVLLALDAATGGSSHVTRAAGGGSGGVADALGERAVLSWERATDRPWAGALVAAGTLLLVVMAARLLRSGLPRTVLGLPLAAASATAASLIVNDSPLEVIAAGLLAFLALRALVLEAAAGSPAGGYGTSASTRAAKASISAEPTSAPSSSR